MRYVFKSRKRLGDVLLCMPSALYLSQQGHEVWIECPRQWHPIFEWMSYVSPWSPECPRPDVIFDTNEADMTRCESTLINHINEWFPELADTPKGQTVLFDRRPSVPDYGLPDHYVIVSPFGYSQFKTPPAEWIIQKARSLLGKGCPFICLTDAPKPGLSIPCLTALSVGHLPALLERADEVVTINSSPNIMASAVRKNHFLVWDADIVQGRTNYLVPHQVVVRYRAGAPPVPGYDFEAPVAGDCCNDLQRMPAPEQTADWTEYVRDFVKSRGVRSIAELLCGRKEAPCSLTLPETLYYGIGFSSDSAERLRRQYGSRLRIFYATDPVDPELPNQVDLVIIHDLVGRVRGLRREELLRRLSAFRHCIFVHDGASACQGMTAIDTWEGSCATDLHLGLFPCRMQLVFHSGGRTAFLCDKGDGA